MPQVIGGLPVAAALGSRDPEDTVLRIAMRGARSAFRQQGEVHAACLMVPEMGSERFGMAKLPNHPIVTLSTRFQDELGEDTFHKMVTEICKEMWVREVCFVSEGWVATDKCLIHYAKMSAKPADKLRSAMPINLATAKHIGESVFIHHEQRGLHTRMHSAAIIEVDGKRELAEFLVEIGGMRGMRKGHSYLTVSDA